jgi:hypothetical protein
MYDVLHVKLRVRCLMPLSMTFHFFLSWQLVVLMEETVVSAENHQPVATLSHNVVSSTPHHQQDSNSQL